MSDASDESPHFLRRILVALDASPHSEAALEAAAQLAAAFGAELRGVFVEDIDLLRSAELPITREVRSFVLPAQTMSARQIRRRMKRQAEQARAALERAARHSEVQYTFNVVRGRVSAKLLEAAAETDLIALGKASTAQSSRRKLGSTARAVLLQATAPVLVLREALRGTSPILVYYDGTDQAERALRLAAQLVRNDKTRPLTVLLPADSTQEIQRLRDAVTERYGRSLPRLTVHPLTRVEAARLATVAYAKGQGLVIIPAESPPLQDANLQQFLYEVDRPVLVVR